MSKLPKLRLSNSNAEYKQGGTTTAFTLYLKQITIIGSPLSSNEHLDMSLRTAAQGRLKVIIDQVLSLSQASRAHEIVEARSGIGKVLLDPTRID